MIAHRQSIYIKPSVEAITGSLEKLSRSSSGKENQNGGFGKPAFTTRGSTQ
jgi:hypothetical protein